MLEHDDLLLKGSLPSSTVQLSWILGSTMVSSVLMALRVARETSFRCSRLDFISDFRCLSNNDGSSCRKPSDTQISSLTFLSFRKSSGLSSFSQERRRSWKKGKLALKQSLVPVGGSRWPMRRSSCCAPRLHLRSPLLLLPYGFKCFLNI